MSLIDTHAHLYVSEFSDDLEPVITRAKDAGVSRVLLPNIDSTTLAEMNRICRQHPDFFLPMMGLHPCSVTRENAEDELDIVGKELVSGNYIAVGEIGIDLYWDKSTYAIQREAFLKQCEMAIAHDLPIVIHSRESTSELIEALHEFNNPDLRGVFHCFTGNENQANEIIAMGFYLGLGGVLTFKNSGLKDVIGNISLEHLVLETDSPYLAPVPFRGKRNESSYVRLVAEFLADLKNESVKRIEEVTSANAKHLFRLND